MDISDRRGIRNREIVVVSDMETPVFHMGVSKKLTKEELRIWKKKQKEKKRKEKQKQERIQNKMSRYNKSSNYTIIPCTRHFCYIPEASNLAKLLIHMYGNSIKNICNLLASYKKTYINKPNNSFFNKFCKKNTWEDDYKNLKKWYFIYVKRRFLFKTLLLNYLISRSKKCLRNTEDPCTLLPPVQRITCLDVNQRCYYQFEAKSLQKIFITSIGYNDWLFPAPLALKNPLTNIPFHNGQILSIVRQLRFFDRTSWMIESAVKFMNRQERYKNIFNVPLRIYGLEEVVRNPTSDSSLDLMEDFVENEYEYHDLYTNHPSDIVNIIWALKERPNNIYIQKWLNVFKLFETHKLLKGMIPRSIRQKSLELIQNKKLLKELFKDRFRNIKSDYFPTDSVEEF